MSVCIYRGQSENEILITMENRNQNTENPFMTKSKLPRTPDNVNIEKRKSIGNVLIIPTFSTEVGNDTKIVKQNVEEAYSPMGKEQSQVVLKVNEECSTPPRIVEQTLNTTERIDSSNNNNNKEISNDHTLETEKEKIIIEPSNVIVEEVEESGLFIRNENIIKTGDISSEVKEVLVEKGSDLEQLSIDEVLHAFREDAESAEKAIVMATSYGRLHPKEFREYLKAFRSPTKLNTSNTSIQSSEKEETNLLQSHTTSTIVEPTYYDIPDNAVISSSPKSSLLKMLQFADSPVAGGETHCPTDTSTQSPPINSEENVEDSLPAEPKVQSMKDRADIMRMIVAAAVASISAITAAATPLSAPMAGAQMHPRSKTPLLHRAPRVHAPVVPPSAAPTVLTTVPSISTVVPVPALASPIPTPATPTNKEDGFIPKKRLVRTPPKPVAVDEISQTDTAIQLQYPDSSIVDSSSSSASNFLQETIETRDEKENSPHGIDNDVNASEFEGHEKNIRNSMDVSNDCKTSKEASILEHSVDQSGSSSSSYNTANFTGLETNLVIPLVARTALTTSIEVVKENETSHIHYESWSDSELERVSVVIGRVSVSAADCPNTQYVVKQLQEELHRLRSEVKTHKEDLVTVTASHLDQLAAVTAERALMSKRLKKVWF